MAGQILTIDESGLRLDGTVVQDDVLLGFVEHWDAWRASAWLEIRGVAAGRLDIDEGYAETRATLRSRYPHLPYEADWSSGRFPPMPAPWAPQRVFLASAGVVSLGALALWLLAGLVPALVWLALWVWPLIRLRDQVVVTTDGLGLGPPWSPLLPWSDIEAVHADVRGARTVLSAKTPWGTTETGVPTTLLPAVRARVWRLGGLDLFDRQSAIDRRYSAWVAPSVGIPWGLLAGGATSVWWLPEPWSALRLVLLVALSLALLGAAVRARHTGWRTGAVLWASLTYGAVLVAVSLAG